MLLLLLLLLSASSLQHCDPCCRPPRPCSPLPFHKSHITLAQSLRTCTHTSPNAAFVCLGTACATQGGHIVRLKHAEAEGLLAAWMQSCSPLHSQKLHQMRRSVQRASATQVDPTASGVLSLFGDMARRGSRTTKAAAHPSPITDEPQIALLVGGEETVDEQSSGSSSSLWEVRGAAALFPSTSP